MQYLESKEIYDSAENMIQINKKMACHLRYQRFYLQYGLIVNNRN